MKTLLIILGAPLWIPLLLAAAAVLLSVYLSLWAIVVSLGAMAVAFGLTSLYGLVYGGGLVILGQLGTGLAISGAGVAAVGLTLLSLLALREAGRAMLSPTRTLALWLERRCYRV